MTYEERAKRYYEKQCADSDWKSRKLFMLEAFYGKKYDEWVNAVPAVTDDRRLYINIFEEIKSAVESLSDNPCNYVCVAMNEQIGESQGTLDNIKATFA